MKTTFKQLALVAMGAAMALTASGKGTTQWVDLGLPSGVLWAKCNLGATKPEGNGDYYAWGETAPKKVYNFKTYKYCKVNADGQVVSLNKYNLSSDFGTPDSLTVLAAMDDIAAKKLGGGARIPTVDEWRELYKNTTVAWTKQNGVNGLIFTAPNGNSIFLPAAGSRSGTLLDRVGSHGYYWSSSLHPSEMKCAWSCRFDRWDKGMYPDFRYAGYTIRPVRSAS